MAYVNFLKLVSGIVTQHDDALNTTDDIRVRHLDVIGDLTVSGSEIIVGSTTFQGNVNLGDSSDDIVTITSSGTTLTGDGVLTLGGLSSDKLLWSDSGTVKNTDLSGWVADFGGGNISVADDGSGGITLDTAQDIASGDSPTFAGLTVTNAITEFSTDGTLSGDSDSALPTEKAVKLYVDTATSTLSGSMDHGGLLGLGDDDHTQYILVDGTRAFTGNVQANASGTLDIGSTGTPFGALYADDVYVKGTSLHIGDAVELSESSNDLQLNSDVYLSQANETMFYSPSGSSIITFKLAGTGGPGRVRIEDFNGVLKWDVNSDGTMSMQNFANFGGAYGFNAATNQNVYFDMGDNAGVNSYIFRRLDSTTEVASIDSLGNADFHSDVTVSGYVGFDNSVQISEAAGDILFNSDLDFSGTAPTISCSTASDNQSLTIITPPYSKGGGDLNVKLGDTGGLSQFNFQDSGGVTVASVDSDGNFDTHSNVTVSGFLSFDSTNSVTLNNEGTDLNISTNVLLGGTNPTIYTNSSEDIIFKLADTAGVQKVSIRDSANAEVAWIDSDGNASFTTITGTIISDSSVDHGSLSGLGDDDHTQYILHSLADAANDFLVASGDDTFVRKTLAETGAILEADLDHGNIQGLGDDDHTQYILADGSRKMTANWNMGNYNFTAGGDITASGSFIAGGSSSSIEFSATSGTIGVSGDTDLIQLSSTGSLGSHSADFYLDSAVTVEFDGSVYFDGVVSMASTLGFTLGTTINEFSIDGTMAGNSDDAVPTEQAVVEYVTAELATLSGSMDHGGLGGLGDDDHTQYILVDGTRAFTGNVQANASGTLDIGSSGTPFASLYADDVYVKGSSIHLGNTVEMTEDGSDFAVNADLKFPADKGLKSTSASNLYMAMGDNAGVNTISFRDSDNAEVAWIDSNGNASFAGDVNISGSVSGTQDHAAMINLDYASAGHTGFAPTVHDHTESQITDLQTYVLPDGSVPFTSTVAGITPSADADLATKAYVDSVAVAPDSMTVASGTTTAIGSVLYVSANDTVDEADKDDSSATKVVGLARTVVVGDGALTVDVQADGILAGALVGATAGTRYYLSDDGALDSSPPSETGDYVLLIGIAANATDIFVRIGDAILL